MATITSANAVYMLSIGTLFPIPVQLQGFAADDIFNTEALDNAEIKMGVDGVMSFGFKFVEVKQKIILQADSASNAIFDLLYATEQTLKEKLVLTGVVMLPSIGTSWNLIRGVLSSYQPIPNAKTTLQPREYGITWNSVSPAVA
jgi:hypothetical protein